MALLRVLSGFVIKGDTKKSLKFFRNLGQKDRSLKISENQVLLVYAGAQSLEEMMLT